MLLAASCLTVLWDRMTVRWAADIEVGWKKRRDVGNDSHQRAGQGALVCGSHGNDDVVLVPHVEGIRVGVGGGTGRVQGADCFHSLAIFCHFIVKRAQQTVCGWIKEEG